MNVPELRFPEFSEEWEEKKLGDISSDGMYGMNAAAKDFDGENKYIRITDISEKSNNFVPNPLCSPNGNLEDKFLLNENDLLFARTGASTGKSYLYDKNDGKLYFAGFLIKFNINKADAKFVFYNTLKTQYENWVRIMSVRSGQPGINAEEYKKMELNLPSIKEQVKIASFLSKVDKKIEKLEKKQELWETYKKGMMQKIFSQELRFKDGNGEDYPDWEEKILGAVVSIPKKQKLSSVDNETLLTVKLHCKGIEANYSIQPKITKRGRPYFKRNAGELLIGRQNFHNGGIGIVPDELDGFISSNAITSLKIDEEKILKRYLLYYFSRIDYYKKAEVIMGGTGQKELSDKNLLKLEIKIPVLKEQHKIAKFLFSIENEIDLANQELELCVNFKKGLLQKMFC